MASGVRVVLAGGAGRDAAAADVLYLWVDSPCSAVSCETSQGHLVQLDPETREFVGVSHRGLQSSMGG
jgi:hypothetical protein